MFLVGRFAMILSYCFALLWSFECFPHSLIMEFPDNAVDTGYGQTGIALDGQGRVGVCYQNINANSLKFAFRDNGIWTVQTVDNGGGNDVGEHCALVFDADENPHLLYFDMTASMLKHARRVGGVWHVLTVDNAVFAGFMADSRLSVRLAPDGNIAVAYYDARSRDLGYAEYNGVAWVAETVLDAGDVGHFPSLAFDENGFPAIAYAEIRGDGRARLSLIRSDRGGWLAPEIVDDSEDAGRYAALAIDGNGTAHIAYLGIAADNFRRQKYLHDGGGDWMDPLILGGSATGFGGDGCMLTLGSDGDAHVIFKEDFNSALFGRFHFLKLVSLYFTDQGDPDLIYTGSQNVAFAGDSTGYSGLAIAADADANLAISFSDENWDDENILSVATLTSWMPAVQLRTPSGGEVVNDDSLEVSWMSFDPEGTAKVRFYRQDKDWNVALASVDYPGLDPGNLNLDVSDWDEGDYRINVRISGNDFNTYAGVGSVEAIRVIHPAAAVLPAAAPVVAPVLAPVIVAEEINDDHAGVVIAAAAVDVDADDMNSDNISDNDNSANDEDGVGDISGDEKSDSSDEIDGGNNVNDGDNASVLADEANSAAVAAGCTLASSLGNKPPNAWVGVLSTIVVLGLVLLRMFRLDSALRNLDSV